MSIKLFVMDVDGTLTDGKIYMSAKGEAFKVFNVKDGYGIRYILKKHGILTAVITGRESDIVKRRVEELDIDYLYQGVTDKHACLEKLLVDVGVEWSETMYVGDDINDIECMKSAGWSACPNDAHENVKRVSGYVSRYKAGEGAVRDIVELVLKEGLLY